ncbi:hypothetical protein DERP_014539 [Dermatophagoides pteronyssinus]|uniref:Uncharacterized protein n=1 Tax=Dermatophagoides pteronyssinus TaxID=6956 RepID=A0ABQ8J2A7_DERPT|nr:hypothetical protein DERP_014539 [Dermatophagoides pteronyssinus]
MFDGEFSNWKVYKGMVENLLINNIALNEELKKSMLLKTMTNEPARIVNILIGQQMSLPDIWKKICEKFDVHQDAILEIKNELNLIHQIDNENQTLNLKKEKDIVEFKNEQSSTPVEELMEPELEKDLNFDNDDLNNDRDKDDVIEFKRRFDQVIGRFFDPYEYLDLRKLKLSSWNREVLTNDWDERLSDHNINGALSLLDCVEELKKLKMNRNLVTGGDVHAFADVKFHFPNKVTIWSDSMMNLHRHGSSFKNLELADRSRIIDSNYCLKNFKFVVDANCFDFKDSNLFKTHRISSLSTKDFEFADQVEDFVEKLLPIGNTAIYRWNLIFKLAQHGHDVDKIKLPIIIDDIIEIKTRDPNYCPIWIPKNSSLVFRLFLEKLTKLDNRKFEWIFFPPGAFVIAYGRQQPTNVDVLETNGIWPIRLKVFRFKFKRTGIHDLVSYDRIFRCNLWLIVLLDDNELIFPFRAGSVMKQKHSKIKFDVPNLNLCSIRTFVLFKLLFLIVLNYFLSHSVSRSES